AQPQPVIANLALGNPAGHSPDRAVHRAAAARRYSLAHLAVDMCRAKRELRQPRVRKSHRLQPPHRARIARKPGDADLLLGVDDLLEPPEEPRVEAGNLVDPLDRE